MLRLFSALLGNKRQVRRQSVRGLRFRPALESLESRQLLAADIAPYLEEGMLIIEGSPADDAISIRYASPGTDTGYTEARYVVRATQSGLNGEAFFNFNPDEIQKIVFRGNQGNDHFRNHTNLPLLAFGGPGNDTIYGGLDGLAELHGDGDNDTLIGTRAPNKIFGGPGEDVIFGLEGNDLLVGGSERDILYGYEGADVMFGGTGADKLYGGPDPDFVDGGRDFTPDVLGGEWNDNFADRASDVFVNPAADKSYFVFAHTEDRTMLDSERDYEAQYLSNPQSIWSLLGIVASGYTIDDSGTSFEFTTEDHDVSLIEPDWATEVLPVDDYFVELAAFDLETMEEVSWADQDSAEQAAADQAVLNDVALLALLADELPSVLDADLPAEPEEHVESTEALEVDPLFASEPELTDHELLDTDISLLDNEAAEELPAEDILVEEIAWEEPAEETFADETYTYESYVNAWSGYWSSYSASSSWARFRW